MRQNILVIIFILVLSVNSCGCVPLIIGGAVGAAGAYAASKDTVEGETDTQYDKLWKSAVMVSKVRGTIEEKDSLRGTIQLKVGSSKVSINLIRITEATTKLKVSARKYHLPDLSLAQDIFVNILEGAE